MKKILILFIVFLSVITNIYSQTDNNDDCMCGVYPGNSFQVYVIILKHIKN
jgi:hypothetical protein